MSAGSKGLNNITRVLDAPIGDNGFAMLPGLCGTVIHCRDLRYADAGDNPCRTDGTRSDTDFYNISSCFDQILSSFSSSNISSDDGYLRVSLPDLPDCVQYPF
ncbi:Uncharacterised protein [Mycobacteroides abscessus subsp. abscessus]|nr:Uncharacterised protein [Mycobacteroides abscessus subsp. abscessus]